MPKPSFQEIGIECWEYPRKLGFAQPTICLFHTEVDLGRPILEALEELQSEGLGARRMLSFKASDRKRSISTLRLRLVSPRDELRVMNITRDGETLSMEMTDTGLRLVHDALSAWCSGGEDFGISPRDAKLTKHEFGSLDKASGELWFWGPTMEP